MSFLNFLFNLQVLSPPHSHLPNGVSISQSSPGGKNGVLSRIKQNHGKKGLVSEEAKGEQLCDVCYKTVELTTLNE